MIFGIADFYPHLLILQSSNFQDCILVIIFFFQLLAQSEPVEVPGYYEARYNPIRRATMWPLNQLAK